MGREIKYRFWDREDNVMRDDLLLVEIRPTKEFADWSFNGILHSQRFIPLQYTGLRDKNGTEIFEGDIVKFGYPDGIDDEDKQALWRWKYALTGKPIEVRANSIGWYPFTVANAGVDVDYTYPCQPEYLEVIGNIYENPELLKEVA